MQHESILRLSCFLSIFACMTIWESLAPYRVLSASKPIRWLNNIALVLLNTLLLRLLLPLTAVNLALLIETQKWGLLQQLTLPIGLMTIIALILLDLAIYWQHRLFHQIPLLWRLHRMHHADIDIDVTTGTRFHPVEIILSMLIKFLIILIFGIPAIAVLLFEVILNGMAMFNHSNIKLNKTGDKHLRLLFVTPDMHRVHHSINEIEMNRNFGFNLAIWDRIFNSYQAQPTAGHQGMTIGLDKFREAKYLTLPYLLWLPIEPINQKTLD
ncbi:sterol desaturase family protein [Beggiatoa leptomitoformis]|uniref:sterol desaturase family protein n=1 Tax=Beggiatoa leptomitoformis TaxID=288004 RepID=UPI00191F13B4|nr:sterol desaturase family protein [Beggiatoa leptomitoformis]